jgi:hypothetical protein
MFARWTFLMVLAGLLGPIGLSSARAQSSEDLVTQYLEDLGATGYAITAVNTDYIANSFPDTDFFEVRFRQWPIAVRPPEGLSASNVFLVQNGEVFPLTSPADLRDFFFADLPTADDEDDAADAGLAWLRLSEGFSQDGFYTFGDPEVTVTVTEEFGLLVTGIVTVTMGGRGDSHISVEMLFDSDGVLQSVSEENTVQPGVRPICQATKLLDADSLVRRMAERDILIMGRQAAEYLYEQRIKARPELQEAIDRIWQRIVDEGPQTTTGLRRGNAAKSRNR